MCSIFIVISYKLNQVINSPQNTVIQIRVDETVKLVKVDGSSPER